jgi:hypothetical protein
VDLTQPPSVKAPAGPTDNTDVTTLNASIPLAMPAVAKPQAAEASPLSAAHLREMHDARLRAKKIRRCVTVANFDGWSVGVFGALTLLFGVFSVVGWVLGGGMIAIAYVELSTVPRIKQLDPKAARRLGWNQLALASLLLGYAGWSLYGAWFGPDPLAATIAAAPETAEMLAPYSAIARLISVAVYVALAAVAIFAQGGTALYYFTREKHIRAYREQTPGWIIEMQQSGAQL